MKIREIFDVLEAKFGKDFKSYIYDIEGDVNTLLTDSRNLFNPEETLFFAIKTPGGNDGHCFIDDLLKKGVRNFVVENNEFSNHILSLKKGEKIVEEKSSEKNENLYSEANFFIVNNSIEALSEIGKLRRGNADEIVAITGSRGKTTLKEIIFQLLEPFKKISRSPRSYNSKIGVPLSLWQINEKSDLALIEAGISKAGEMENLQNLISPDTVIFTNIGDAHSNGFESMQHKADEKTILAFADSVKNVIYNSDDIYLETALKSLDLSKRKIRWSRKNPNVELFIKPKGHIIEYTWKNQPYNLEIQIEKEYDFENFINALAFMLKEGFSPEFINSRFKKLQRISTRLNVTGGINGCSIILDSYTSDLSSLLPALDFAGRRKMPSQTLTLILSDLHHESINQAEAYSQIAKLIEEGNISKFIGIGENICKYSKLFPKDSGFYPDIDAFLKNETASDFYNEIILLKGSKEFKFEKISELLEAKKHETVLEVNLDSLLRNYNYFKSFLPSSTGIIAMVKASGYGAGSYEIAKTLQDAGASYLAVAALDEGIELRDNGIVMPIMVMNPKSANYRVLFKHKLEPVVYSMSMLKTLIEDARKYGIKEYPIHIKLDTGMHRMGFESQELEEVCDLLEREKKIKVSTIFSHLATADCLDMDDFTDLQLKRFEDMSEYIIGRLKYPVGRHILNSAGIIRFPKFHYEYVRLGIGLYGANTLPTEIEKPLAVVSTLRSVIICIREIDESETVGYGRRGKISAKTRVATLPLGYADGIDRRLGNGNLKVMVNGEVAPTIGNICMDATMIDVTGIDCKEGDSVEIFGEKMNIQVIADTLATIPYEILTSVSPRVKRIYYRE